MLISGGGAYSVLVRVILVLHRTGQGIPGQDRFSPFYFWIMYYIVTITYFMYLHELENNV